MKTARDKLAPTTKSESWCPRHGRRIERVKVIGADTGKQSDAIQTRDTAWKTAAKCAALAKEADDPQEREYFARMRDAWITLANRCEYIEFPDVTEK
jgi:hypothetical protein